jgi:hypothetical protein
MALELTVYSPDPAISLASLIDVARRAGIELRAYTPEGSSRMRLGAMDEPLDDTWCLVVGWPREEAATTAAVGEALARGDLAVLNPPGTTGSLGGFEFSCTRFDFEEWWNDLDPDESDEEDDPIAPEELERMRQARTKYFFRCNTRPSQNGKLQGRVAEIVAAATDGFLAVY